MLGFVVSICLLITSPNIITILLGWDGLGLISYCLVIYYPTKKIQKSKYTNSYKNYMALGGKREFFKVEYSIKKSAPSIKKIVSIIDFFLER